MSAVYIFEPHLDQAIIIAKLFRIYSNKKVFGVVTDDDYPSYNKKYYHGFVQESDVPRNAGNMCIPTGAISTEYFLERGDIPLGDVYLSKNCIIANDKTLLLKKAVDAGIPIPKTWANSGDIPDNEYPVFYKQNKEAVKDIHIRGIANKKDELPPNANSEVIFQEFIEAKGIFQVCYIASDGEILDYSVHYVSESIPKVGGSALFISKIENTKMLEYTRSLIKELNYSGWGQAEYIYCSNRDDYVFLEINAKFWASCDFAFRNNPEFTKLLFNLETKNENIKKLVYFDRAMARGRSFFIKNILIIMTSKKNFDFMSGKKIMWFMFPKLSSRIFRNFSE